MRILEVIRLVLPWRDAKRYRVVREELVDRWLLGSTMHSPEDVDKHIDYYLRGGDVYGDAEQRCQARSQRIRAQALAGYEPKFSPMPPPRPLWGEVEEK